MYHNYKNNKFDTYIIQNLSSVQQRITQVLKGKDHEWDLHL